MPSRNLSNFNYAQAYGPNPFSDPIRALAELIRLKTQPITRDQKEPVYARPTDTAVQDYLGNILGGQRTTLDDYVRRSAAASVGRGGFGPVRGVPVESDLHAKAMATLASGFADRFSRAMDYGKYAKESEYRAGRDSQKDVQDLYGTQFNYLKALTDLQSRLGDLMRADWAGDVNWERDSARREIELDYLRNKSRAELDAAARQAEMDRQRNYMEIEAAKQAMDEKQAREAKWTALMRKAGQAYNIGKFGAGWTWEDDAMQDRLGVELGYLKPWTRSFSIKMGK